MVTVPIGYAVHMKETTNINLLLGTMQYKKYGASFQVNIHTIVAFIASGIFEQKQIITKVKCGHKYNLVRRD